MRIPARGGIAATLTAAVAVSISLTASPAHAEDRSGAEAGARWLSGELSEGLMPTGFGGYDGGLTLDAGQALVTVGGRDGAVAEIRGAMTREAVSYTTYDTPGEIDADRTAKLLDFLLSAGADGSDVGGLDLVAQLEDVVLTQPPLTGRIQDVSEYGDTANVIGQAFAASALDRAGSDLVDEVTAFALLQQCPDGGFRLDFSGADAADQSCATASESHPDVTALVAILLDGLADDPEVAAAQQRAVTWLAEAQRPDGSHGGGPFTEDSNSNSTGLAAWAYSVAGEPDRAARAAAWVRRLQASDPAPCRTGLTPETGAIAYSPDGFDQARGTTLEQRDQWRRASAQALPALLRAPGDAPSLTGPTGFVRAGTSVDLRPTLGAGARGCLSGAGLARPVTGPEQPVSLAVPAGTARHTVTLASTAGDTTATFTALDRRTFRVGVPRRVERRRGYAVVVRGTVRGERVTVRHARGRERVTARGSRVRVQVRAPRRPGRTSVTVSGQFPRLRSGAATLRVVR